MSEVMMVLFMLQKMVEKHGRISLITYHKIYGLVMFMLLIMMRKLFTFPWMVIDGITSHLIFLKVKIMERLGSP